MQENTTNFKLWDVERLTANPKNARKHSTEQIQEIAASMTEFGFMSAVVVDSAGVILAGNARVEAARALGLKTVPVIFADHLTDTQKRAFAIADNQLGLHSSWNNEILKVQLDLLRQEGVDLKLVGFSDEEFSKLADELESEIEREDHDSAPAVPDTAICVDGDVWELGDHLLVCGDATNGHTYQQLLGDGLADMVFADMPYNCSYSAPLASDGSARHAPITNDNLGSAFGAFLNAACKLMLARSRGAMYICMSSAELHRLYTAFTEAGGHWSTFIIWVKQTFTLGRSDLQRQYEPILYGWPEGKDHYWCGDRDQGDVWHIDRVHRNDLHPTMKPVELVELAITNSSKRGNLVLDPFAGSGTTLIACESKGRKARLIELEPRYCDVIIQRWQEKFPGKIAVHRGTRKTLAELGDARLSVTSNS